MNENPNGQPAADTENTWGDPNEPEAGAAVVAPDLSTKAVLNLRGKEVEIHFDLSNMTPRLKKRLAKLKDGDDEDVLSDTMCAYIATIVNRWTLTDRAGNPVPLTADGLEDVSYPDIRALVDAINGAALPNDNAGAI